MWSWEVRGGKSSVPMRTFLIHFGSEVQTRCDCQRPASSLLQRSNHFSHSLPAGRFESSLDDGWFTPRAEQTAAAGRWAGPTQGGGPGTQILTRLCSAGVKEDDDDDDDDDDEVKSVGCCSDFSILFHVQAAVASLTHSVTFLFCWIWDGWMSLMFVLKQQCDLHVGWWTLRVRVRDTPWTRSSSYFN